MALEWLDKPGVKDAILAHQSHQAIADLAGVSKTSVGQYLRRHGAVVKADELERLLEHAPPEQRVIWQRFIDRFRAIDRLLPLFENKKEISKWLQVVTTERSIIETQARLAGWLSTDAGKITINVVQGSDGKVALAIPAAAGASAVTLRGLADEPPQLSGVSRETVPELADGENNSSQLPGNSTEQQQP